MVEEEAIMKWKEAETKGGGWKGREDKKQEGTEVDEEDVVEDEKDEESSIRGLEIFWSKLDHLM